MSHTHSKFVNPETLKVHPAVADFPALTETQYAALRADISERGILEPLIVDEHDRIIGGRHRLKIALELGIESVEIVTRAGVDPVLFAIETAITGRNLTKSAIALIVFLKHPNLHAEKHERKGGGDRKSAAYKITADSIGSDPDSFRSIAAKYGFCADYLDQLSKIREMAGEENWAAVVAAIFDEEASIPRLHAGVMGGLATKGHKKSPAKYHIVARTSAVTLCSAFKNWTKIKWDRDQQGVSLEVHTLNALRDAFEVMPDAVRAENRKAIATWPQHEREELLKQLKAQQKGA